MPDPGIGISEYIAYSVDLLPVRPRVTTFLDPPDVFLIALPVTRKFRITALRCRRTGTSFWER